MEELEQRVEKLELVVDTLRTAFVMQRELLSGLLQHAELTTEDLHGVKTKQVNLGNEVHTIDNMLGNVLKAVQVVDK